MKCRGGSSFPTDFCWQDEEFDPRKKRPVFLALIGPLKTHLLLEVISAETYVRPKGSIGLEHVPAFYD